MVNFHHQYICLVFILRKAAIERAQFLPHYDLKPTNSFIFGIIKFYFCTRILVCSHKNLSGLVSYLTLISLSPMFTCNVS